MREAALPSLSMRAPRETPAVAELSAPVGQAAPLRWTRIGIVALLIAGVFFAYEHEPAMYAGGARAAVNEGRLLDQFVDDAEAGTLKRKLAIIAYGVFGAVAVCLSRAQRWSVRPFGVTALACLLLWVVASITWSDQLGISIRRLIAALLALGGSLGVARLLRPDELVSAVLGALTLLVTLSFGIDIAAGARPGVGEYRFAGTLHANTQATYCAVLCLAAFCQRTVFGLRWAPRLAFLIGFGGIALTASRTALLAMAVGLFIATTVRFARGLRWTFITLAVSAVALIVVLVASVGDGERSRLRNAALMGRTEQAGTLTGRVPLWEQLLEYTADHPLRGYGYEGFWTPERIDAVMRSQGWTLQAAHNSYLEVTLQLGLIGLVIGLVWLGLVTKAFYAAFEATEIAGYAFAAGLVGVAMSDGLLQTHFVDLSLPTVITMIASLNVLFFFPPDPTEADDPSADPRRHDKRLSAVTA